MSVGPASRGRPQRRARDVILVVDDFDDGRELYTDSLGAAGFEMLSAGSGLEAVQLAVRHRPALILLDLGLPDIDGGEVARRLRADPALRRTLIVGLTAFPH